jgi:hypothetical protein
MFLVVGQPGSEARLVADALSAHPDVVLAGRGDLLLPLAFLLQRVSDPVAARRLAVDLILGDRDFTSGIGAHLDADAVRAVVAEAPLRLGPLLTEVYGAVARAAGARTAGTMLNVLANPVFNRVGLYEGDVRLVHVVRDARTVAAAASSSSPPADLARRWDQANRLFRDRRGGDPARYAMVRVEDFLRHPLRGLTRIAPVLGIEIGRHDLPAMSEPPVAPLDRASRRQVAEVAREGLFVFGYEPPAGSLRRAGIIGMRKAKALRERRRRAVELRKAQAWAIDAPPPWSPETEAEKISPATCNICRWTGSAFTGQQHAESADCPRCGAIARERFHLAGITPGPTDRPLALLETAPRLHGTYAQAMARWFDYTELEPAYTGGPLGHLEGIEALADGSAERLLSAHDLQTVPDPDALLAQYHRVLSADGVLLVQAPILTAETTPLPASDTAAPGSARWSFGVDVLERFASAGFVAELLVTDEFVDLAKSAADAAVEGSGSGEIELAGVMAAAAGVTLTSVSDRATARRHGWTPAALFVTVRAQKA